MKKISKGKSILLTALVIIIAWGGNCFGEIPVYRLYNTVLKVHLYSTDANEKAVLEAGSDWNYEGVVWNGYTSATGQNPVYRLYSSGLGKHLFTMDENEKNVLDAGPVWQFEMIAWYANSTQYSDDIPIYRLYSDALKQHLYSADENEKNTLDGNGVWVYEGIAYYTLPASASATVSEFTLTSVAIENGELLDTYKCEDKTDGSENSIPLSWSNVPAGTNSLAIIMKHYPNLDDLSNPSSYLLLWDIDPGVTEIAYGAADDGPWYMGSNKDGAAVSYTSPCSPSSGSHEYTITLYALSETPSVLPASSSIDVDYDVLINAISTVNVIGETSLTFNDVN